MRAAQYFNNEGIFRDKIASVRWFTTQDAFMVYLFIGFAYMFHAFPPCKNLRTPRS